MRTLLLPVESKKREFDAKVLLACCCAERGLRVVLGEQISLNRTLSQLPKGLYLDKSLSPHKIDKLVRRRACGNMIGCLDEEGLFYSGDKQYIRERTSFETVGVSNVCYTWGPYQYGLLRKNYPMFADRFVATGGPRADLWRKELRGVYADAVEANIEKYGKYILIPSNFSLYAKGEDKEWIVRYAKRNKAIVSIDEESYYRRQILFTKSMIEYFLRAIDALAIEFPDYSIVMRPHPSDDVKFWQDRVPVHDNVHVDESGSVAPWILGAKMMIHNSCTTGLESFIMGTPVVAYQPEVSDEFDFGLPNQLSREATSLPQLIETVREILQGGNVLEGVRCSEAQALLSKYLLAKPGTLASDTMAQHICAIDYRKPNGVAEYRLKGRSAIGRVKRTVCATKPELFRRLLGVDRFESWMNVDRTLNTTRGVTIVEGEIGQLIERYQKTLKRFPGIKVTELAANTFLLEGKFG